MSASLRFPFRSLSSKDFLARGAGGQVFIVSQHVVLKSPTLFDNPAAEQVVEMKESKERIEREKGVYRILNNKFHPNILRCILMVDEGIFLERMNNTLQALLDQGLSRPVTTQTRWVSQMASALQWLEKLGYVHGDLRPANILVATDESIRLADFDASVRIGQELLVASEPFCKLDEEYETPPAGAITEQFSLASCIYTICSGHIPLHEVKAPERVSRLIQGHYPRLGPECIYADITQKCWSGEYSSMAAVAQEIQLVSEPCPHECYPPSETSMPPLLAACEDFLHSAA